jgi:hypothetical protein
VAFPPVPVFPQIPQPPSAPVGARRRRWPWFVGIGLLIWLGGAYFFYQDNERRFAEARNRGVDILSTDEKTGVVTARDQKTGKIIKMDFNDLGPDQVRVGMIGMPPWVPSYPNVADSEPSQNGSFSFSTSDSVAEAAGFYESRFRQAGMTVTRRNSSPGDSVDGVTLRALDAVKNRSVTVVATRKGSGSRITITTGNQ